MPTDFQIFYISPPGSTELAEMGYFRVPRIFDDTPAELSEVYGFTDETAAGIGPSNFWVHGDFLLSKLASYRTVLPLFPRLLGRYVPWILCEYGLHCLNNCRRIGFETFAKNIILDKLRGWAGRDDVEDIRKTQSRRDAIFSVYLALTDREKGEGDVRWRNASSPIKYIKAIVKVKRAGIYREFNAPLIQGINIGDVGGPGPETKRGKPRTMEQYLIDEGCIELDQPADEQVNEILISQVAADIGLSAGSHELLLVSYKHATNYSTDLNDAAEYLRLSKREYNKYRQELHREKGKIQKRISQAL